MHSDNKKEEYDSLISTNQRVQQGGWPVSFLLHYSTPNISSKNRHKEIKRI